MSAKHHADLDHEHQPGIVLSVIVVNWMVRDLLRVCLSTLLEQMRLARHSYEVIVVDNASTDGSVEMVRREFPDVIVIPNEENVGFGRANNQALKLCRGKYLLLLNPDTEVLDHAIDTMLQIIETQPDVGALGCRLLNSDGSYQRWTAGGFPSLSLTARHAFLIDRVLPDSSSLFLSRDVQEDLDVDWITGACMLLRRQAVEEVIFDESFFMYGEDTDLCARLHASGWKVRYTPAATVVHHHGQSMARQTGDVLLTSFKGPRAFYSRRHGTSTVWLYDTLIATGFLVRWVLFSCAALGRGGERYRTKANSSRTYLKRALHVMRGG